MANAGIQPRGAATHRIAFSEPLRGPRRLSGLLDQLPSSHIILADAKALVDELS